MKTFEVGKKYRLVSNKRSWHNIPLGEELKCKRITDIDLATFEFDGFTQDVFITEVEPINEEL